MESSPQVPAEANASFEPETTYQILNSPELRAEYITLTDGLISRLVEDKTDVAIFLDKSARPVAWFVNELWDTLAPRNFQNEIPKKPQLKFLNIDREQWGPYIGRSEDETGGINVNRIPEDQIDDLRRVMAPITGHSDPEDASLLTNKNVMIVDEVRASGDTLNMAEKIIKRAFPDANKINGVYWMPKPVERDPKSGMIVSGENPIWYSDREITGRLVAGRDSTKSMSSNSSRQRAGKYWLSTNFREPDESGRKLKQEVKQVAKDLVDHKLLFMPSPVWNSELEPIDKRIERIDDITVQEYVELRRAGQTVPKTMNLYSAVVKARAASRDR